MTMHNLTIPATFYIGNDPQEFYLMVEGEYIPADDEGPAEFQAHKIEVYSFGNGIVPWPLALSGKLEQDLIDAAVDQINEGIA